ncbi:MAG: hypothetical protein Q9169_008467 [Polycauliona sp. 2 TL-2023]
MLVILITFSLFLASAISSPVAHLAKRGDILSQVNGWRSALGANSLSWNQDLANAAGYTGQLNGGGASQNHHPAPGAAEVISPGSDWNMGKDLQGRSPFEISFIAWICEKPDGRMGSVCGMVDVNNPNAIMRMRYQGTGHYDIVTSNRYRQIGCGFAKNPNRNGQFMSEGQWVCQLKP